MSKDSYWFRHDSTAGRGLRMRKMAHIYGHWGKGIYWDVIEILRDQSSYSFDCEDSSLQMLCDLVGCKDEEKFLNWFKDCVKIDLFTIEDGMFFSPILCENMAFWDKQKRNGSQGGRPSKPKRNPKRKPNVTIIGQDSIDITEQDIIIQNIQDAPLRAKFVEWLIFRRTKRKPISETAKKQQIAFIEKYPPAVAIDIINQSIMNDWQGLFPPKQNSFNAAPSKVKI